MREQEVRRSFIRRKGPRKLQNPSRGDEGISPQSQSVKTGGGDCFLRCKDSHARCQEYGKSRTHDTTKGAQFSRNWPQKWGSEICLMKNWKQLFEGSTVTTRELRRTIQQDEGNNERRTWAAGQREVIKITKQKLWGCRTLWKKWKIRERVSTSDWVQQRKTLWGRRQVSWDYLVRGEERQRSRESLRKPWGAVRETIYAVLDRVGEEGLRT